MLNIPLRAIAVLIISSAILADLGCTMSPASSSANIIANIKLTNPSEFPRVDEAIYWSLYDLGVPPNTNDLNVWLGPVAIPSELVDRDGDGKVDALMTLLDFDSAQSIQVQIRQQKAAQGKKRTQADLSVKVGGHWQNREGDNHYKNYIGGTFKPTQAVTTPDYYSDHSEWIRYEGPGIESDRVAYRVYLDGRNGFDIFGKTRKDTVLQNIGLDGYESYHHLQDWGMDILKVGPSLGAGGFAYWHNDQALPLQTVAKRHADIIHDGNIHSSFKILYGGWQPGTKVLDAQALITMTAGSRLFKNKIRLTQPLDALATGFVAHPNSQFLQGPQAITDNAYTYIASWGQQSLAGDNLGMALFYKRGDQIKVTQDDHSHIAVLAPRNNALEYYFAAAWQQEAGSDIQSLEAFELYLQQQAERLSIPIRQQFKTTASEQAKKRQLTAAQALHWSTALGESELRRKTLNYHYDGWDENRQRKPKFEYDIVGLLPFAYDELGNVTGNKAFKQVKHTVTASFIADNGDIRNYRFDAFNIDSVAPGRALLRVQAETPQKNYTQALHTLREQLRQQPRTHNGAFWHKQKYPGQLWLDGVYMGMPFLAEYALKYQSGEGLEDIANEFLITRSQLRDPATGLYFHAWDENKVQVWADKKTGLSSQFWSRGMGWLAMALADVIAILPDHRHTIKEPIVDMAIELALTLKSHRNSSGLWSQIMDKPNATGNYSESSATAMFVYFYAKLINLGILTERNFGQDPISFVTTTYQNMIDEFILVHADGDVSLLNQCLVAGLSDRRDGQYHYYMSEAVVANDPKATGPFILAGVEVFKLLQFNEN